VAWDEDGASSPGTFLLTVLPPEPTGAARPRDVALVLDRSGSMQGWKMAAARRAAARIVDTLTAADRFVVLTFDDVLETPDGLTDGLVEGTDRHRFRAVRHLAAVEARGGTEMEPPLRRAAALLAGDDPGRDRVLILVTDGQVGNEDRLLKVLGQKLAHIRVHTVGIDSAVNAGFLRRLATLGGGHCELVESEDRLDEAMDAVHRRIGTPLVTGLRLAGTGGLEPDQDSVTPGRLPDLFAGAPLVVAGRIVKSADRSGAESDDAPGIVITGKAADGSAWTRTVAATETADAGLAQFWARGRIRDLEDRYVSTYDGLPEIEQAIVATSVRHSVLSRFTAFVVVDTRVVAKGGALKQVTQPVDLPDGWETDDELDDAFLTMSTRSVRTRGGGVAMPKMSPAGPGFGGSLPQAAPPAGAPVPPMPLMAQPAPAAGAPVPPMPSVPPVPPVPPRPAMPAAPRWEPVPDPSEALDFAMAEESRRDRPSPDDLQDFATIWLPRLIAAANDTAEAQEELLTEFIAKLRDLSPSVPGSLAVAELLDTLESSDKPLDERRHSAIAFLESLKPVAKPRRTPFWKR
jgi:Ca-activated chloride channel family protein